MISTRSVVFLRNASQNDTMLCAYGQHNVNRLVRRLRYRSCVDGGVLRSVFV
jgi:hypothetical protein